MVVFISVTGLHFTFGFEFRRVSVRQVQKWIGSFRG